MNIDIYLNDGKVVSSIGINGATIEEALSAIKAFGFGENEEEWLYSDNQKIRYRVEDSDKIRIKDLICECSALKDTLNDAQDECDDWKAKYDAECQQTDILKKTCDELSKDLKKVLDDFSEWKKDYDILLKDRNRLIERLHELSAKFEKGEQE